MTPPPQQHSRGIFADRFALAAAGDRGGRRARDLPRLRARLGRLHPRRIRRPAAGALRLRLHRSARAVLRQSLRVRRRLRSRCRARREVSAVQRVRDAAADRRAGRHDRAADRLADRPAHRRPARRPHRARAARDLPALSSATCSSTPRTRRSRSRWRSCCSRWCARSTNIRGRRAATIVLVGVGPGLAIGTAHHGRVRRALCAGRAGADRRDRCPPRRPARRAAHAAAASCCGCCPACCSPMR